MKSKVSIVICGIFFLCLWASATGASTLWSLDFTGNIEKVTLSDGFPFDTPCKPGDSFNGSFTYDLDVIDLWVKLDGKDQYPNTAMYSMIPQDPYYGSQTRIGDYDFLMNPGTILVWDNEDYNLGGADRLDFISRMVVNPEFQGVVPYFPFNITQGSTKWTLQDGSMTALSSQALPIMIALEDFQTNEFSIFGSYWDAMLSEDVLYSIRIEGRVDSVTARASSLPIGSVPEPSSWLLLGLGFIGLAGLARKTFRQN